MTYLVCPRCNRRVRTTSTVAGPFELPPKVYCVHDEHPEELEYEMRPADEEGSRR